MKKGVCTLLMFMLAWGSALAQNKVDVTISLPSSFDICLTSDTIRFTVRNITTTTVPNIEMQVELPLGVSYQSGSLSGSGITEKNISNLNKPIFSFPSLGLAAASTLGIRVNISCSIANLINNGGLAVAKTNTAYSGGSVNVNSSPWNVRQPSVQIQSITNQLMTADVGQVFVRSITIKNNGTGRVADLLFRQVHQSGLSLLGTSMSIAQQSGDTVWHRIDSADFAQIGNGDGYLGLNETVVVHDTVQVKNCNNLRSFYFLGWGCQAALCATYSSSATVSISTRAADLLYTVNSTYTNCFSSGTAHPQEIIVYNRGNDSARTFEMHVFQSWNTGFYNLRMLSQMDFTSFSYKRGRHATAKSVTPYKASTTQNTGFFSCLGTTPVGEVFLKLPALAPGDSLILQWTTRTCCPDGCNVGGTYAHRWKYESSYKNQCGTTIGSGEIWGNGGTYQSLTFSKFTPSDIRDGESVTLEYNVSQGNLFRPIATSQMQVELILPQGLSHSGNAADLAFLHPNGTSWYPQRFEQNGDTVWAIFRGVPTVTMVRSELLVKLQGSCGSITSNGNQSYQLNVRYNPDTTCSSNCWMLAYCDQDEIKLHCATSCSAGLHFNDFKARRTNFGQPDNNNDGLPDASGSLNMNLVKDNRIMFGDTLLTTFRAKVYNSGSTTNWYYGKATSRLNYGRYLSVADVRIKIYRAGNLLFNCNNILYTSSSSGNAKTFTFDIGYTNLVNSNCALYSSFSYLSVDSIELEVTYVVDQDPGNGLRVLEIDNDFYLSTVANPSASQRYQCDSFSSKINLIGSYFTNYGKNVVNNAGCADFVTSQSYYLSIGECCANYAGGNIFPYEYRAFAKLHGVMVKQLQGFDIQHTQLYHYRTAGTGAVSTQRLDTLFPSGVVGGWMFYPTDSLFEDLGGPLKISDDGFHGTVQTRLLANCHAETKTHILDYAFIFQRLNSMGSGLDTLYSTLQSDWIDYVRPELSLVAPNLDVYATSDTVEWEVRVSNTTSGATASNLWFGAEYLGNVRLLDVIDKLSGQTLPQTNGIHKFGGMAGLAQKDFIVRAVYTSCDRDSLQLLLGFDCTGYPDSLDAYPCTPQSIWLRYEPVNTRLESTINSDPSSVDLCADRSYVVFVRNTASPKVFDLFVDLNLRPGMVLGDTAWFRLNGRSDSFLLQTPQYLGANVYRYSIAASDSLLWQKGMNGVDSSTGYTGQLRFWLSTNCNFTSGSYFLAKAGGFLKCGKPVNASTTISDPINIKGVVKPYFSSLTFSMGDLGTTCDYEDTAIVRFINLGPDTTGNSDQLSFSFPLGLWVDTAASPVGHNAPQGPASYTDVNGESNFRFSIPSGIAAGDSCVFRLKTYVRPDQLSCGEKQLYVQAVIPQNVICVTDSSWCNIDVATSSVLITDTVNKAVYAFSSPYASSVLFGGVEQVQLNYVLSNSGAHKSAGSLLHVKVVYDQNGNGVADSGETVVAKDTLWKAIPSSSSTAERMDFNMDPAYGCALLLTIDDSNCLCGPTYLPVGPITLRNAGKDTLVCARTPIWIGTDPVSGFQYRWNDSLFVQSPDSARSRFIGRNPKVSAAVFWLELETDRGACTSVDSLRIVVHPEMKANLLDSAFLCTGDTLIIGEPVGQGVGSKKLYQWNPVDSMTRPTGPRTQVFPAVSTNYVLTATDEAGCQFKDSTFVEVVSSPVAAFDVRDSCASSTFFFQDKSLYPGQSRDSIHWSFPDGSSYTLPGFQVRLDSAGSIRVQLYVQNNRSCWDTTSRLLTVHPLPIARYTTRPACEGDSGWLYALSTISSGVLQHEWTLGGNRYPADSLGIVMPYDTAVQFRLDVRSDRGCIDSAFGSMEVFDRPAIAIQTDDRCFGDSIPYALQLASVGNRETLTTVRWDLGDGNSDSLSSGMHLYADTGSYDIRLIAATARGCADTVSARVAVHAIPLPAMVSSPVCLGDSVFVVQNSTSYHGTIDQYEWDLGSGYQSGGPTLGFLSTAYGKFPLGLRVTSSFGCTADTVQDYLVHYREAPAWTVVGHCENEVVFFTATPVESDSIRSYLWTFGTDTLNGTQVSRLFGAAGQYWVGIQTETNRGCTSDALFSVKIDPITPADLRHSLICNDNQVRFETGSGNPIWELGDGSTDTRSNFIHRYPAVGNYTVRLYTTNGLGCKDTGVGTVVIENLVVPAFTIRDACVNELQVVANRTAGVGTPLSRATFDMGNGEQIESFDSFLYTYDQAGTYSVKLTVSTLAGCDYDSVQDITIHPLPVADFDFTADESNILDPQIVFTDMSQGADLVRYRISTGFETDERNFRYAFTDSGHYRVQQWVRSDFGCLDSIEKVVFIDYAYIVYIPNAFSPFNGDPINRSFKPIGFGLRTYEIEVYNRWGEEVFRSAYPNHYWDGAGAQSGMYVYKIKIIDYKGELHQYSGTLYLLD